MITSLTILTLPPSTNLTNDPFKKSADLSKKSIEDNPYDQRTNQDTCPHDRSENWNSNQCADCGHTNIGGTRVADEKRFAEIAKKDGMPTKKIEPSAMNLLKQYTWSGNVRELRNVIERLMILGDDPITKKNIVQFAPK